MTLAGIDVSNYQGAFDWPSWRGKVQFAGIKISEGAGYADPFAARNVAGARSIGVMPMGYHFLHAGSSGTDQANSFLAHCKAAGMERGDVLAVDVEQGGQDGLSPAQLWSAAAEFAGAVHDHFGCWTVCYTDISLAAAAPSSVGNCPLWLANPSGTPVSHIGPWQVVSFEQLGQTGVDTDVFYGTADELARLAIPAAAAPPVPPKPTAAEAKAALDVLTRFVG